MSGRRVMTALVLGGVLLIARTGRAGQAVSPGCAKIVAVLDESGGSLSAEEISKKTNTDVETVRSCTDAWRAGMKDAKGPKAAAQRPMAPGCAKIVGVLDQNPGLSADEIPLEARILFVADSFEAMTSDRPYRDGRETREALDELRRCSGTQFDPDVVDALIALVEGGELAVLAVRGEHGPALKPPSVA